MRRNLAIGLATLVVLSGAAFAQEDYTEIFHTGWLYDNKLAYASFMPDLNGDGLRDFAIFLGSDLYYTDTTSTDAGFFGADLNIFWMLSDISVAPLYLSYADIDNDGKTEIIMTGHDHDYTAEEGAAEYTKSLVHVYGQGSSAAEWTTETDSGVVLTGTTSPLLDFDGDNIPDLYLPGISFNSTDSYLYRHTGTDAYELLWQTTAANLYNVLETMDFDFDGQYELFLSQLEDEYQTECALKMYAYNPSTDTIVKDRTWYFDSALVIPGQCVDINNDGTTDLLLRVWNNDTRTYDVGIYDSDTQQALWSYGYSSPSGVRTYATVFSDDNLGNHDLDGDGNPDIVYYGIQFDEEWNRLQVSCYVDEYSDGSFQTRFSEPLSEDLLAVMVRDLDGDGYGELCLYYFILKGMGSYDAKIIVYDPMNGYQEKFRIEYEDEQPVPWYAPIAAEGADVNGDGTKDFYLNVYSGSETRFTQRIEIYNGQTGALEWTKEFGNNIYVSVDWAEEERTVAGHTFLNTDVNGNGKLNFIVRKAMYENEELAGADFSIYEYSGGVTPPKLEIWIDTDKDTYVPGDTVAVSLGAKNEGGDAFVDVYVALIPEETGTIYCAPSWQPGIWPWFSNLLFPSGLYIPSTHFFSIMLPSLQPKIDKEGKYWFAAVLAQAGDFSKWLTDVAWAPFDYGAAQP